MGEQTPDALASAIQVIGESVARIEANQEIANARLDEMHLNGDAATLKRMAKSYPRWEGIMTRTEKVLPSLEALVGQREARSIALRQIRKWVRWDSGGSYIVKTLFTGFALAATALIVYALWPKGTPSTPPTIIPVSPPAVHATASPSPTPHLEVTP